jgi:hypothetical protein
MTGTNDRTMQGEIERIKDDSMVCSFVRELLGRGRDVNWTEFDYAIPHSTDLRQAIEGPLAQLAEQLTLNQ